MMKFLKGARGFSIPELMVAVGISGIVALAASQMMGDAAKNKGYIETLAEINKVAASAQGIMANKVNCNNLFSNSFTSATDFSTPIEIGSITVPITGGSRAMMQVGNYGKFSITSIKVMNSTTNARVKDIVMTFIWNKRPYLSTATIEKRFSVFAEIDYGQNGVLDATDKWVCGGVVRDSKLDSQKALCDSLGTEFATWGTPIAGQCNIKQFKCPPGEIPFSLTSLGKVICKRTQDAMDVWALTDTAPVACPASTTNIKIVFSGGRYRLQCGGGCTPTNSNWGPWSGWSPCSSGLQTSTRSCTGTVTCGGSNNCTGCSGPGCPTTSTQSQTCSTGGLPDGTQCATDSICIGNRCSDCINPPLNTCGGLGQGQCGGTTNCSPVWSCL